MTENWAPEELSPEEEAEFEKYVSSASEDEPAQLQSGKQIGDEPPAEIDRRTPSERFNLEKPSDEESPVADKEAKPEPDEKAEKTAPEQPKGSEKPRPPWFEALPENQREEAAKYLDNMHAARAEARAERRRVQEEADRRAKLYETTIKETIAKTLKEHTTAEKAPDPDIDPEGYAKYQERRAEDASKRAKELEEQQQQALQWQQQQQELKSWLTEQEDEFREEHPDYNEAVQYLAKLEIEKNMEDGAPYEAAQAETTSKMNKRLLEYHEKGWNIAKWVYNQAVKNGWGQQHNNGQEVATQPKKPAGKGEKIAEAISAGEKASRALGSGGTSSTGELTLEDISRIKDPDEHDRAYEAWVNRQLGRNPDWT